MTELLDNIDKLHTTELGKIRVKNNLNLSDSVDLVEYVKYMLLNHGPLIFKKGKNWYALIGNIKITINSSSYTIITAKKVI